MTETCVKCKKEIKNTEYDLIQSEHTEPIISGYQCNGCGHKEYFDNPAE